MTDLPRSDLSLRPARAADEPQLLELIRQAHWNQTAGDWQNLMTLAPQGVWVMDDQGQAVASVSVMTYPGPAGRSIAWIGMLIVDANHRRMGIATKLLDHGVGLALQSCEGVKLDATEDGRRVYQQHDFVDEYTLVRLTAASVSPHVTPSAAPDVSLADIRPMGLTDLDAAVARDRLAFGADRQALLRQLYTDAPQLAFTAWQDDQPTGFCLGRPGRHFVQIGPVQATDDQTGVQLILAASAQAQGQPVVVDVVESHDQLMESLTAMGFTFQRRLYRMFYKANPCPGLPGQSLAVAGYEFG